MSNQSIPQSHHDQSQPPHSSSIYLPQSIVLHQNGQSFTTMPSGSNFIQIAPKDPKGNELVSPAPQHQSTNNFVGDQSSQPLSNQYYTFQTFPSPSGSNPSTLLSSSNQFVFTVGSNSFTNQPIVFNSNSLSKSRLIAPAIPVPTTSKSKLKKIAPAASTGTQTGPITIPIHIKGQPNHRQQIQFNRSQSHPPTKSSNLDTATTVTLVPLRQTTQKTNKNQSIDRENAQSPGTVPDLIGSNNQTKNPQKAIIKPYISDQSVLSNVIDRFVIQESPSSFQDNIASPTPPPKPPTDPKFENGIISDETKSPTTKVAKSESICENCYKSFFKLNKKKTFGRFCSVSCAKHSKNLINHKPNDEGTTDRKTSRQIAIDPNNQSKKTRRKVTETSEPLEPLTRDFIPARESNPNLWNVQDVYDFVRHLPGCQEYADEFKSQEIDGQALMLLKEDHLMSAMNMKLGPALKICSRITSLFRAEANKSQA